MRDTTIQLLNASLEVFKENGYQKATTKEIARRADVAEVTLYRKFSTKKALFEETLRHFLNLTLEDTSIDPNTSSATFIPKLLRNRLERMSKQEAFIKLLIRESLSNTIPEDLHFEQYVEKRLKSIIAAHLKHMKIRNYSEEVSRMIIGMLLSYILIPSKTPFHTLKEPAKQSIVTFYTQMIIKSISSHD